MVGALYLVCLVLATLVHAFVLNVFLGLATRRTIRLWWLDCISFSTNLRILVQSTSIASLFFVYFFDDPDYVDLCIAPSMGVDQAIRTCL
jgi:hypothetical protein